MVCVFKFYFSYIVPSVLLFREIKSLVRSFPEIPLAVTVFWAVNRTKLGIFHLSSVLKVQILECWSNSRLQSPSIVIPIKYNFYIISHIIVSLQKCKFVSLVLALLDDGQFEFICLFDHQGIKSDTQTEFAHSECHLKLEIECRPLVCWHFTEHLWRSLMLTSFIKSFVFSSLLLLQARYMRKESKPYFQSTSVSQVLRNNKHR